MANKQIFISYFHEDRPFARRLRARLEEEEGFKTRSDLDLEKELGADYDERLSKWLAESYFILVLLSPGTLTSDKVRAEFEEGLRRERRGKARVIPLLVEPCPRQDLDNFIGKKQYGDFTGNFEAASKVLLASLKRGPDEADEADEDETDGDAPDEDGGDEPGENGGGVWGNLMASRNSKVITTLIATAGAVAIGYWQFGPKSAPADKPTESRFFGRVLDEKTQRPIASATVYVEGKGAPLTLHSDSVGVFAIDADKSVDTVHIKVDAANCKPFDNNVRLGERMLDVRLQCSEASPDPPPGGATNTGFTYDHNPTVDEVRTDIERVRKVSITYRDRRCEHAARKSVVRLNQAQLNGVDAKDILENGAGPRTDLHFSVNIRQAGASYEVVCAK